ncbi:hypothetical protein PoB_006929300 [Plakobranchus ocellatus]|uniref:Uncharacterized protein n=1 Tax=Plakobranchus ocellatus TaxID=259542 RepID=A0AAV4DFE6_9GAST|nr:hypothetical protein PoB_006929300 [Plakobranchus ocellatus]
MDVSPTIRESFPRQKPSAPKIDTNVNPGIVNRGTTLDPKHNAGRRHRQNMWTMNVVRALDTVELKMPVPKQITLISTLSFGVTQI